jgi:cytochrome c553
MPKSSRLALPLFFFAVLTAPLARAEEPAKDLPADFRATPEQEAFFEKSVRPILVAKCLECHGEKKQEGGLRLDSRAPAGC